MFLFGGGWVLFHFLLEIVLFCLLGWISVSGNMEVCDFSQSVSFFFTIAVLNSIVEWNLAKYTFLEGGTQNKRQLVIS